MPKRSHAIYCCVSLTEQHRLVRVLAVNDGAELVRVEGCERNGLTERQGQIYFQVV